MRMPAIFVGHGSPMNAILNNEYTENWAKIGREFKPKAILMISAHWYTDQTLTQNQENPEKTNDMYGFPEALYTMTYPVHGDSILTERIQSTLGEAVTIDNSWGIDHGAWSVLVHMYPKADVPIVQVSVHKGKSPEEQFELGIKLKGLRDEGYMIIASGNVVHNLGRLNPNLDGAYPWASEFDDYIEEAIMSGAYDKCIQYLEFGEAARLSVPTPDHYYPLLNLLGAVVAEDCVTVFNKGYDLGSVSMTSYLFQ